MFDSSKNASLSLSVKTNSSYVSNLRLNAGNHTFLGSLVDGGEFVTISLSNSAIHSTNITMNAASTLVSNGGAIFGSDLTNSKPYDVYVIVKNDVGVSKKSNKFAV